MSECQRTSDKQADAAEEKTYTILSEDQLNFLLEESAIVKEEDTLVSGFLRILKKGTKIMVQETSMRSEIILRHFSNMDEARKLYDERMDIYEKMWNGCGCKVNYYEK